MKKQRYCIALMLAALGLAGWAARTVRPEPPAEEAPARQVQVIRAQPEQGEATLYIGRAGEYAAYPYAYEGEATPDQLIAAIGALTGWDLSLDGPVLQGETGITVTFSQDCALFTGPPDPQAEEFFVYDAGELCAAILDSVCHTLQWNAVNEKLADPRLLPVYFRTAAGDLIQEDLDFTQPETIPYGGLIPSARVCAAQCRFLGMRTGGEAIFDLGGQTVSMAVYDGDAARTLSRVTPGLEVEVVYLQSGEETVLTGAY